MCHQFFNQLRDRFPVKNKGELKMYTGCAFVRDWEHGVLEVNQTAFVDNLVSQYKVSTTLGIPISPGIEEGEPGVARSSRSIALW